MRSPTTVNRVLKAVATEIFAIEIERKKQQQIAVKKIKNKDAVCGLYVTTKTDVKTRKVISVDDL